MWEQLAQSALRLFPEAGEVAILMAKGQISEPSADAMMLRVIQRSPLLAVAQATGERPETAVSTAEVRDCSVRSANKPALERMLRAEGFDPTGLAKAELLETLYTVRPDLRPQKKSAEEKGLSRLDRKELTARAAAQGIRTEGLTMADIRLAMKGWKANPKPLARSSAAGAGPSVPGPLRSETVFCLGCGAPILSTGAMGSTPDVGSEEMPQVTQAELQRLLGMLQQRGAGQ